MDGCGIREAGKPTAKRESNEEGEQRAGRAGRGEAAAAIFRSLLAPQPSSSNQPGMRLAHQKTSGTGADGTQKHPGNVLNGMGAAITG